MTWVLRALCQGIVLGVVSAFFVFDSNRIDLASLFGVAFVLLAVIIVVHSVAVGIRNRPKRRAWFEL